MHEPVLLREVAELLAVRKGGVYIDGTVGSGGHTLALLERAGPDGFVLGIDADPQSLERAASRLDAWQGRFALVHGNFADIEEIAGARGIGRVDGVLMDLGISSDQLDDPERGFSFAHDGPLDMRTDRSGGPTAADIVNGAEEEELRRILREFGEEPRSRAIARAIVRERELSPVWTTGRFADVVSRAAGGRRGRLHPATKSFMALRIVANRELEALPRGLAGALRVLAPDGRMAVISFNSLEDRIAKRFFAGHVGRWVSLAAGGEEWQGDEPAMQWVTRKPVTPSEEESLRNARARSAKLRVARRV
jgi:16S rRNA (cytosine1402-N4)-methyltransferase